MLFFLLPVDTHNALFLSSAKGKPFATYNCHVTISQLLQVLFKFASLDDSIIKVGVEVRVTDDVDPNGLILLNH